MAQIPERATMRGKKRPWCDDNSQTLLATSGNIVVPNYTLTTQANLNFDGSLDTNQSDPSTNNTSFVAPSTEGVAFSWQDLIFDDSGRCLMGDHTMFPSSLEEESLFDLVDLPHDEPRPPSHEEKAPHDWEVIVRDRPRNQDNGAPGSLPDEPPRQRLGIAPRQGPKEQEWEEHRPLITLLYGPEKPNLNLTLQDMKTVMDSLGFLKGATNNMYKNRFAKWGIVKNESNGARRRRSRPQQQTSGSTSSAGMTPTPPQSQPLPSDVSEETRFVFPEFAKALHAMFQKSMQERPNGTWDLRDKFRVVDDDWEDAYGSAAALILELFHNPDSPSAASPWEKIHDDLAPMVQSLNYFSVPTLFMIAYMMCTKLKDARVRHVPACFIGGCLHVSRVESEKGSIRHGWLTKIMEGLYSFTQRGNNNKDLLQLLSFIIPCYMQLVRDYDDSDGATALSLVSFYHVRIGSGGISLESTLNKITSLLKEVDDKEPDGKASIEIRGLAIMVLQEMDQDRRLMLETSKMRKLCLKQLKRPSESDPERKFYLDRLLDGYHLEIRVALKMGDYKHAQELKEEYEELVRSEDKAKDGFAKILEIEIEEMTSRLEGAALVNG